MIAIRAKAIVETIVTIVIVVVSFIRLAVIVNLWPALLVCYSLSKTTIIMTLIAITITNTIVAIIKVEGFKVDFTLKAIAKAFIVVAKVIIELLQIVDLFVKEPPKEEQVVTVIKGFIEVVDSGACWVFARLVEVAFRVV